MNKFTTAKNKRNTLIKRKRKLNKFFKLLKYYPIASSSIILAITIILVTCIVMAIANLELLEIKSKNDLGDAMGGIANPIIAFIGVFVTFLAFYIQYRFNREQSKLIAQQRAERIQDKLDRDIETSRENFDKKFYELLQLHSNNVKEFNIDNRFTGRKTFVKMYEELEIIFKIVNFYAGGSDNLKPLEISYSLLFHGLENKLNVENLKKGKSAEDVVLILAAIEDLKRYQNTYFHHVKVHKEYLLSLRDINHGEIDLSYYPFDGHSHRLGHYFRHLNNFLQIIDSAQNFSRDEKQEYFDIVRSQLSNYEQTILYYNIINYFFDEWYVFIVNYKFLKNLPLEYAMLKGTPEEIFCAEIDYYSSNGEQLFQWVDLTKIYSK